MTGTDAKQAVDQVKLKDLTQGGHDIKAIFDNMGRRLSGFGHDAILQFRLRGHGHPERVFSIHVSRAEARVSDRAVRDPTLEITTTEDTWLRIANGSLAPLEAFGSRRLMVNGSTEVAVALVKHLRAEGAPMSLESLGGTISYLKFDGTACSLTLVQPDGTNYSMTIPPRGEALDQGQVALLCQAYAHQFRVYTVLLGEVAANGRPSFRCLWVQR